MFLMKHKKFQVKQIGHLAMEPGFAQTELAQRWQRRESTLARWRSKEICPGFMN